MAYVKRVRMNHRDRFTIIGVEMSQAASIFRYLLDEEIGNMERCSHAWYQASLASQLFWGERLRRQYEAWLPSSSSSNSSKSKKVKSSSSISGWKFIKIEESFDEKIKREAAEKEVVTFTKNAATLRLNWQFATKNWHSYGAPPNAPWRDQYRTFALACLGVQICFAVINCDTRKFHCWIPVTPDLTYMDRHDPKPAVNFSRQEARTHVAWEKLEKWRQKGRLTKWPWLGAPERRHYESPHRKWHTQVVMWSKARDDFKMISGMALHGTAFCVHAISVYAGNYKSAERRVEDEHTNSLCLSSSSSLSSSQPSSSSSSSSSSHPREWHHFTLADCTRCVDSHAPDAVNRKPSSVLCRKRVSALYLSSIYARGTVYEHPYLTLPRLPQSAPQHAEERRERLLSQSVHDTLLVETRHSDLSVSTTLTSIGTTTPIRRLLEALPSVWPEDRSRGGDMSYYGEWSLKLLHEAVLEAVTIDAVERRVYHQQRAYVLGGSTKQDRLPVFVMNPYATCMTCSLQVPYRNGAGGGSGYRVDDESKLIRVLVDNRHCLRNMQNPKRCFS